MTKVYSREQPSTAEISNICPLSKWWSAILLKHCDITRTPDPIGRVASGWARP